jgi:hypothetical protein
MGMEDSEMCDKKILGKFVKSPKTETVTGLLKETNTLDGKPLFKIRK